MVRSLPRRSLFVVVVVCGLLCCSLEGQTNSQKLVLSEATVRVDPSEPSYVQYAAKDLTLYLSGITGQSPKRKNEKSGGITIILGEKAGRSAGVDLGSLDDLGNEGFLLRTVNQRGSNYLVVAGHDPHGTNAGIATLIQMIRADGTAPYVNGALDVRSKPQFAVRGIHLNGWPLKYPYAFRTWKEEDWKRFIDIAWAQNVNLFYLWPFMEVIPLPLSAEDRAYLEEVNRVVEYAQKERGMQVWIMQSANRIGVTDCGSADPRYRTYWVVPECQKDMNPADPNDFAYIMSHFEALYKVVNNADGFCMIDSDPGGWPGSPLSDQAKIFNGARKLLNQYSVHREQTKLIDWMWIGWGRHPTGEDSGKKAVDLMQDTIKNFKNMVPEPWELIAGISPYLESAKRESVLDKTTFLEYGAIEMEPAFPATNTGFAPVQKVFEKAAEYPELKGIMGNNELMVLQLPRTFYFFKTAWDSGYKKRDERDVLLDLAEQLYPGQKDLIADAFVGLRESDPVKVNAALTGISGLVNAPSAVRAGALSRFLFPDALAVARNLEKQLQIRAARQDFIKAMDGTPSVQESKRLLEAYFDRLLAWNHETGWDKMIDITIWRTPIYEQGNDLTKAMTKLKKVLSQGKSYTTYTQIDDFLAVISGDLTKKYGRDSVMIGCVEPFKVSMIQGW
ncbi:MAG TPA: alpha-glucuronidase family glycosyl hydrolase [Terriglobales bacterium]|nr:alpha-glucuronidase family glycosyl hydrolase [Terriglobales bacterium]